MLATEFVPFCWSPFGNVHFLMPRSPAFRMTPVHSPRMPQRCVYTDIIAMSPTPKTELCNSRGCNLRVPHSPLHRAPNKNPCSRWHQTLSMCTMAFLQLLGTVTDRVHCSLKLALFCFRTGSQVAQIGLGLSMLL